MKSLLWLLPLLPVAGAAICGVLHLLTLRARKLVPDAKGPSELAGLIACGAMAGALAVAIAGWGACSGAEPAVDSHPWVWIQGRQGSTCRSR